MLDEADAAVELQRRVVRAHAHRQVRQTQLPARPAQQGLQRQFHQPRRRGAAADDGVGLAVAAAPIDKADAQVAQPRAVRRIEHEEQLAAVGMDAAGQPGRRARVGGDEFGEKALHMPVAPLGEQAHVLRVQRAGHGGDRPQQSTQRLAHGQHQCRRTRAGSVLQRPQQHLARHELRPPARRRCAACRQPCAPQPAASSNAAAARAPRGRRGR